MRGIVLFKKREREGERKRGSEREREIGCTFILTSFVQNIIMISGPGARGNPDGQQN